MDKEEREYIDQKFAELEVRLTNPDPKEVWERSKKYRGIYYKYYLWWSVIVILLVGGTMLITFRMVGLF